MPELLEGRLAIAHLLRRAGFGPDAASLERFASMPYADAVDAQLAALETPCPPDPEGFDPYVPGTIQQVWLERMVQGEHPLAEKLAFFWHGHFATSNAKVKDATLAWAQYKLFRAHGGGRFRDLVLGVSRDVAMIRWLDGNANRKGHANENYGRELQELFTLGIGNYAEQDIREISRAFTGWGSRHHDFVFRKQFHDEGEKTVHGQTGTFGGEDVVEILTARPACHTFIARKLIRFFSHPEPSEAEVDTIAAVFRESDGDLKATLGALFKSDMFLAKRSYRSLVKSPVEVCVGALRAAGLTDVPPWIHGGLDRMGQILFRPPSVKGWTSGTGWLSSGAIVERLRVAQLIATHLDRHDTGQTPETVADTAFQGDMPEVLTKAFPGKDGKAHVTMTLGCPEFQLA